MKCRKASIKDADKISNVLVASYNIKTQKEGRLVFREELKKGHRYIVAIEDGKIAGIVTWVVHGLPKHQLCELVRIAVLPDYKGKGVAKLLFDALVKDARGFYKTQKSKLRKLFLLTHDDNERAHGFYEKMGFKHETTLKEHYYQGVDERVYSIFF